MDSEEEGLLVKESSCFDRLVRVEVIFFSQFCEGQFGSVIFYPIVHGGTGDIDLKTATHCSLRHADCMALVIVCECRQDELWWVGCVWELPIRKALIASFTKVELYLVLL